MPRGVVAVNRQVTRNIIKSWFVTVPVAAVLAIAFSLLGRWLLFDWVREVVVTAVASGAAS